MHPVVSSQQWNHQHFCRLQHEARWGSARSGNQLLVSTREGKINWNRELRNLLCVLARAWQKNLVMILVHVLHRKDVFLLAKPAWKSFSVCTTYDAFSRGLGNARSIWSAIFLPTQSHVLPFLWRKQRPDEDIPLTASKRSWLPGDLTVETGDRQHGCVIWGTSLVSGSKSIKALMKMFTTYKEKKNRKWKEKQRE